MTSRYTSNPNCADCGKPKGPKQVDNLRCFRCQRIANQQTKERSHAAHIEATYGITLAYYNLVLAFQGGKCAICCRASGKSRRLAVDHDHACTAGHPKDIGCRQCVRGLLCQYCNRVIGRYRDDPQVGDRMARYLREPPFQVLLRSV